VHGALAIDGGSPVRTKPVAPWPAPGDEEVLAAERVLRSGRLNYWSGEQGRLFEEEYAASLGRSHALAVANGTLALELALRAFGIGPGDEVVIPARTFIATAGAAVAVGATPVVADIDAVSNNMTRGTAEAAMSPRTRAVIPVHLGGWPVDMDPIIALANEHDLVVIEDCAQAHGGTYNGRPVGALGSHAAAFSFCQDKIVPVGDGGMLVLDDDDAWDRAWSYRDHGKSRAATESVVEDSGVAYKWLVESFGSNWRLDEISSAVGRVGLSKLGSWHAARARNAKRLADGLSSLAGLTAPLPGGEAEHAFYRLYASVSPESLAPEWTRDRIISAVIAEGVPCQYGTCAEIYREKAFVEAGYEPLRRLPGAQSAHERSLAFFVHPTLTEDDIDDTIQAVTKVMEVAVAR